MESYQSWVILYDSGHLLILGLNNLFVGLKALGAMEVFQGWTTHSDTISWDFSGSVGGISFILVALKVLDAVFAHSREK